MKPKLFHGIVMPAGHDPIFSETIPELKLPKYDLRGAVVQLGDSVRVFEGFGRATRQREQVNVEALRSRLAELAAGNDPPPPAPA